MIKQIIKRKIPQTVSDCSDYQDAFISLEEIEKGTMADNKLPTTFKLRNSARLKLQMLSHEYRISQAEILAILIHSLYDGYDKEQVENWLEQSSKI